MGKGGRDRQLKVRQSADVGHWGPHHREAILARGPCTRSAHSFVPPTLNRLTTSSSENQASSTRRWRSSSISPGQPQLVDAAHPKVLAAHSWHLTTEPMCLLSQIRGQHALSLPVRPHSLCNTVSEESPQISLRFTRSPVLVASLSLWVSLTQKSRLFTHCTTVFEQMCLFSRI